MVGFKKFALASIASILAAPAVCAAQDAGIPGFENVIAAIQERLPGNVFKLTENVELTQPDMKFYADQVEYFGDTNRLIATGNVLVIQKDHQIAADRADFNAKTKLGTFYNARGFAAMGVQTDASAFGTIEPDVQFYGETLEKIGPDVYVITHGGFTTCTQPNPRWMMTSGSLKLRVDHYAFLKNTLLKAKGVPVLYLPLMYYPISKENRSTGLLLPSYGSSTIQGQTISNGFFWAINRSQDATIQHDWYSKTGQQVAGEYRYVSLVGSGNVRTSFLNEHPRIYVDPVTGSESPQDGRKSYSLTGGLSQGLGHGWYGQARADFASSQVVKQTYSTDITQLSSHNRSLGGSVTGSVKTLRLTGTYDRNENFGPDGSSALRGNAPRVNISRPDRLMPGLPVYYTVGSDYVHLVNEGFDQDRTRTRKDDIDRLDVVPVIRFPYTKLPFLSVTSSLMWRNTFWSDSLALLPDGKPGPRIPKPISRQFFEMSADVSGPTLVRIWDTPNSSYAQRFKHTIEPFMRVTHRTTIDNAAQIIKNEYVDYISGGMTQYDYGSNTRLYAKKTAGGPQSVPREIIGATIRQSYYTDPSFALTDPAVLNSPSAPRHFSPVNMTVRSQPTEQVLGSFRTEFDARFRKFTSIGADGSWNNQRISLLAGWSEVLFRADNTGKNIPEALSHYFNSNMTLRFKQNRYGLVHSFNYDVKTQSILQQRIAGYYNAQCCGFTAEYQTIDLKRLGSFAPVPQDSRFHFSVTLAGIGNVSNIFGALSGTPNR
jgi:LPS-assembly protein